MQVLEEVSESQNRLERSISNIVLCKMPYYTDSWPVWDIVKMWSGDIFLYLLEALLLESIIPLRSLGASQLGVFLLEDWLHDKVVNLGQMQNEMNKKSRSCTFTFSQGLTLSLSPRINSYHQFVSLAPCAAGWRKAFSPHQCPSGWGSSTSRGWLLRQRRQIWAKIGLTISVEAQICSSWSPCKMSLLLALQGLLAAYLPPFVHCTIPQHRHWTWNANGR